LKKLFVDGRTYGRTDIFPLYTIRSTFGSRPKKVKPMNVRSSLLSSEEITNINVKTLKLLIKTFFFLIKSMMFCGLTFQISL